MAIPQFPSQDLAKLVLGYLAEEQLMTAYDEFLHASPYLDALRNEYDRIFMTSLRNILAEYRAVKIFVETCKPFMLRKKLVQCTNLVEVVKVLVSHVDVNKLQTEDVAADKKSLVKHSTSISTKPGCDVCDSMTCICNSRLSNSSAHTLSQMQTSSLESSVETTALEDLPGNHVTTRKKHVRVLEKETIMLESEMSQNLGSKQSSGVMTNSGSGQILSNSGNNNYPIKRCDNLPSMDLNTVVKTTNPEYREKIEEFNNILSQVCNEISSVDNCLNVTESVNSKISNTTNFQDFASGVCSNENRNAPVPDSSTSESINVPNTKEIINITGSHSSSNLKDILSNESATADACNYPRIKPKPSEQKIKILSDVKVDNSYNANNNATSTPLMQTIVINGAPAYKPNVPNSNYTKDEIMAMPTIIVVPSSGKTKSVAQRQFGLPPKLSASSKTVPSSKRLGPLVIDVSSSPGGNQTVLNLQQAGVETGLVKTVDAVKNASVPKDNIITCAAATNTPQVLPPLRKSSSTPRRNSHIRVLDFTTPRRILHETIDEQGPISHKNDEPIEVVLSKSPSVTLTNANKIENTIVDMNIIKVHKIEGPSINITSTKNDIKNKRSNWDADLRALAMGSENHGTSVKTKKKSKSKKKVNEADNEKVKTIDVVDNKKPRNKKKVVSPNNKKSKRVRKVVEEDDSVKIVEGNVSVKPTIKIISAQNYGSEDTKKGNDSTQNKSNTDEANETPEAERICLQNVIGAKLNISELLETPYKQALYDIQMETPKFLGPDLPGEPISDIKIMNIPTPRFFDTPKPAQATPSSYSSRPTDYSSGGSYYKPDDQDYIPIPDLECLVSSSKPEFSVDPPIDKENDAKKSRPVRQCTKNVSYFNSTSVSNKTKDDKTEMASSCSESTAVNSSFEKKEFNSKTPKNTKPKSHAKSETKKRLGSIKKYKSPIKKTNTFMKIKPRRPTPTKESYTGKYKRKSDANLSKETRKKSSGKEKNIHMTPTITSVPAKSRRKSSTPRKLHCTKIFNSESSGHDSPETNSINVKENIAPDKKIPPCPDSDTEQLALRWSDDGSQDAKHNEKNTTSEIEDITKIKEYIETTAHNKPNYTDGSGALHVDLIKRGFDAETAKIIERDLLDTPPHAEQQNVSSRVEIIGTKKDDSMEKSIETVHSSSNNLLIAQDEEEIEEDEIELSVHDCNEESNNYVSVCHDDTKDIPIGHNMKLKDKFSMEVCIDDGVTIRLRANDFTFLFDHDSTIAGETGYSFRETEIAVSSIANFDKLYTPLKDQMKATCYEIFDSTLTSLDTPLKPNSPISKQYVPPELEIVVDDEKVDGMEKTDTRKRKRLQNSSSPEQVTNDTKKTKSEAQYLLNSTNIQNIDIESVLKKLHGP